MLLRKMRTALQAALLRRGIDVRKAPAKVIHLPIFPLAVEAVMSRRGKALKFVQVGANDGIFGDPLRKFVLNCGWTGVLVEPQPDIFAMLCKNYAGCEDRLTFENIAVSNDDKLTLFLPPDKFSAEREFVEKTRVSNNAEVIARQAQVSQSELRKIEVPAMTLDALLAKHAITELDLLQIDCEGYDFAVLQTLDLGKVKPLLIQFESGHMHRTTLTEIVKYLNDNGYLVYYGGWQGDAIAMRKDVMDMPLIY